MSALISFANTGVKIRRPDFTTGGINSRADAHVTEQLMYLNKLLSDQYFLPKGDDFTINIAGGAAGVAAGRGETKIKDALAWKLEPREFGKNHTDSNQWDKPSLLSMLFDATHADDRKTLEEVIDSKSDLSELKYAFTDLRNENFSTLDYNVQTVLNYEGILNYLVAAAYYAGNKETKGLTNYILSNRNGVRSVIQYIQLSAARQYVHAEKVDINYNDKTAPLSVAIIALNPSFSANSFKTQVLKKLDNIIVNSHELHLIKNSAYGASIPAEYYPALIARIRKSIIPVTDKNVDILLPLFLEEVRNSPVVLTDNSEETDDLDTSDYTANLDNLNDSTSVSQFSLQNVYVGAQMFFNYTLGEELDLFNLINYFTHQYMMRGTVQLQDRQLREDLQRYVFSNTFTDVKNGQQHERTRSGERAMFYRQTLNAGNGKIMENTPYNRDFNKLWKILMVESAKYIERAQDSPNPESYVSRQPVMQAVEDLQYNLSLHCSGMSNVISPIINKELEFIIQRIFQHPEVIGQLVPAGGSWWKVVELMYTELHKTRPKTTVLANKARMGYTIIRNIAEYTPTNFEDDQIFSDFISNVDAFIITQAQLAATSEDEDDSTDYPSLRSSGPLHADDEEYDDAPAPAKAVITPRSMVPGMNGSPVSANGHDEWDF